MAMYDSVKGGVRSLAECSESNGQKPGKDGKHEHTRSNRNATRRRNHQGGLLPQRRIPRLDLSNPRRLVHRPAEGQGADRTRGAEHPRRKTGARARRSAHLQRSAAQRHHRLPPGSERSAEARHQLRRPRRVREESPGGLLRGLPLPFREGDMEFPAGLR